MFYWIRVGDGGEYQSFDDLDSTIDYLNQCEVGQIDHWVDAGPGVGIDTPNFHGNDFVSLFVGDLAGNLVRVLNGWERGRVEAGLQAAYN